MAAAARLVAKEALDSPERIYHLFSELSQPDREILAIVLLDIRYRLIQKLQVSVGAPNESLAHLREMLKPATFIRRMLSLHRENIKIIDLPSIYCKCCTLLRKFRWRSTDTKVLGTNLAARLRRKGGLLTETNTGTERTKLLATVAEASFKMDESALWPRQRFLA